MKAALGFTFALVLVVAYWYGYAFSMTVPGFPIQGYIGALIPVVLVLFGAAIGAVLMQYASNDRS